MKPSLVFAIALLALIACMQALRFTLGWEITIDGLTIPRWASAIAAVLTGGAAVMLWRDSR